MDFKHQFYYIVSSIASDIIFNLKLRYWVCNFCWIKFICYSLLPCKYSTFRLYTVFSQPLADFVLFCIFCLYISYTFLLTFFLAQNSFPPNFLCMFHPYWKQKNIHWNLVFFSYVNLKSFFLCIPSSRRKYKQAMRFAFVIVCILRFITFSRSGNWNYHITMTTLHQIIWHLLASLLI